MPADYWYLQSNATRKNIIGELSAEGSDNNNIENSIKHTAIFNLVLITGSSKYRVKNNQQNKKYA